MSAIFLSHSSRDNQAAAFADVSGAAILACADGTARVFDVERGGAMRTLE